MNLPSTTQSGPLGRRLAAVSILLFSLTWPSVRAQDASSAKDDSGPSLTEQIIAEESSQTSRLIGLYRFAFSHPQTFTARVGTVLSRQPSSFRCTSTCDHIGPLFQVEAGTGSAQISAGYARIMGDRRKDGFFLTDVYVGFGVKGALLRTFGNTTHRHRNRTYVGVEGEFTITNVNFTAGAFYRVSDQNTDDHWLTVFGVGWGF